MGVLAGRIGRDDRIGSALAEPVAQLIGVIGAIRNQPGRGNDEVEKIACALQIVGIAWRQSEGDGPAARIGQGVDLGRAPAARAADGVRECPPFAPAAERWALMWVLSTAALPTQLPVEPVSAKNISRQMPCRLQRLKRL